MARQSAKGPGNRWNKGQKILGDEREALAKNLVRQYSKGASIRAIADAYGRSYGFVHRILTESGVELRTRRGTPPPRTQSTKRQ